MGTLTVELAVRVRRVVAIDLDPACVRATRRTTAGLGAVEVVEGDALDCDPDALGLPPNWLAAGNIPYTITGALLQHLLEMSRPPQRAVLLVQREVAERLTAAPGGWSLSTVAVRSLADVERLHDVPPHAFEPPPAVHSSVLRLTPRARLAPETRTAVLRLAKPVFQQRRKTLRNALGRALGSEPAAVAALAAAGIDAGRRPGTLDLEEWAALTRSASEVAP